MLNLIEYDKTKPNMRGKVFTDENGEPLLFRDHNEILEYTQKNNIKCATWSDLVETKK